MICHSLCRCYVDNSGHVGPWNFFETEFSNRFFTNLVEDKYTVKTEHKVRDLFYVAG